MSSFAAVSDKETKAKRDKVVAARARLRERFEAKATTSGSEGSGTGPANRHGMPKLPPGQTPAKATTWPVLDLGVTPRISNEEWQLEIRGLCEAPSTLRWHDLMNFEQVDEASDFHCVTTWSRMDIAFRGVRLIDVLASAHPSERASHIMCYATDGYCTNLSLTEALKPDVLLAYRAEGEPLSAEHGGPVRVITPQLYAWKGAKWICAIEFMDADRPGFWEKNGYSMTGNPWLDDRYS